MSLTTPGSLKFLSLGLGSLVYFVAMVWVGFLTERVIQSSSDFLVSGRERNHLMVAAGIAAIGVAGSTISALPQYAVQFGLVPAGLWIVLLCVVYVLFGVLLAPVIRRTGVYTTSEWMEQRFSKPSRVVTAVSSVLGIVAIVSAQFVGMGAIFSSITGLPFWVSTLVVMLVTMVYLYLGGLWAVTVANVIQVITNIVAILVLVGWLGYTFGGVSWLMDSVPTRMYPSGTGVVEWFGLQYTSYLTWVVGWMALVFANQYYWIQVVSARSEADARVGTTLGALTVVVFFSFLLALPGVYFLAGVGSPAELGTSLRGIMGYFVNRLPIGLDALVFAALLSAVMSTASGAIIGASSIMTRDIWEPLVGEVLETANLVKASRVFTVLLGVLSWGWAAIWTQDAGLMLAVGWSFLAPLSTVFLMGLFWARMNARGAFYAILGGIVGMLFWKYAPLNPPLTAYAHMTWVGVGLPALIGAIVSLAGPPRGRSRASSGIGAGAERGGATTPADETTTRATRTRLRTLIIRLARPCTPFPAWDRALTRRGIQRRGLVPRLLAVRPAEVHGEEPGSGGPRGAASER